MQKTPKINWIYAHAENTMMKVKSPYQQEKKNYSQTSGQRDMD